MTIILTTCLDTVCYSQTCTQIYDDILIAVSGLFYSVNIATSLMTKVDTKYLHNRKRIILTLNFDKIDLNR